MRLTLEHKSNYQAFTLLEALIYTFVLAALVSVMTGVIIMIYRYKTVIEDRVNVNDDLRTLVKSIQDDMYLGVNVIVDAQQRLVIGFPGGGGQVMYFLQGHQVYRQLNGDPSLAITSEETNVIAFDVEDISSTEASGTVQVHLNLSNFPSGTLKPEIREEITSTISLKFI